MKNLAFLAILAVPLLWLGGCAGNIKSDVVTFHQGTLPRGETIRVVAMDESLQGSLEFEHYAGMIRDHLSKIGYNPVTADQPAQLLAKVDYQVSDGITNVRSDHARGYAHYHFYYGRFYDPFYYGFYDDWRPEVYSYTVYNRLLHMNIVSADDEQKVIFEGRVQSIGREREIARVMPYLITAMFSNFPGESGVTKVVTIDKNP